MHWASNERRMERLRIRLFGKPAIEFDGAPWKLSAPPRCLPLLALLATATGTPPTRAWLASALWPDEIDEASRSNLRRHLHRLARALPPAGEVDWIEADDRSVAWNAVASAWIDVRAFQTMIADEAQGPQAVELYRGDLLEHVYDECIIAERERLRTLYLKALDRCIRDARAQRNFFDVATYAGKLLALEEWRESALREWMSALYVVGGRADALAGYERFAQRLREEFKAAPAPETTALRDAIRAGLPLSDNPERIFEAALTHGMRRAWSFPFVGRTEELDQLSAAWRRAVHRSGSTVFISGEPGVGKSRLVAEVVATTQSQGGQVLIGTTSDPEGEPYQAIVTALRLGLSRLGVTEHDRGWLVALGQVLPEIHSLHPNLERTETFDDDYARERLFEAFVRAVERLGRTRPLCLVLEDLHWAGSGTLDALATLARRVGALPVLIVVTYRRDDAPATTAIRELRGRLTAERRAAAIPLERLTEAETTTIVRAVVDDATVLDALSSTVARLSEGNPLFAAQLIEEYRETGTVPDASSALRTVRDAIAARVDRLDGEVRAVAQTAAMLGPVFAADIVAAVGGWDENAVLDAIGSMIDRSLVREAGSGVLEYTFTHALIAASLHESADSAQKTARHRRAAQVLERANRHDRSTLAAIGRHWQFANEPERAALTFIRASRSARSVYAREEALEYAHAAYTLSRSDATRFQALEIAIDTQIQAAHPERWHEDLVRLEQVAESLGIDEQVTGTVLRARYAARIMNYEDEERAGDRLFKLARTSNKPLHLAEAHYARGYLYAQRGSVGESIVCLRQALELTTLYGDFEQISRIREQLVSMLARRGDLVSARAELAAQRDLLESNGAPVEQQMTLLRSEATIAAMIEDGPWLDRVSSEMLDLAHRLGHDYLAARAHAALAHSAFMRRDFRSIRSHYDRSIELFRAIGDKHAVHVTCINRSELELRIGRVDEARYWLEECRKLRDHVARLDGAHAAGINHAQVLLQLGQTTEALAQAREAYTLCLDASESRFLDQALTILAAAEAVCGELDAAVSHLEEALVRARLREAWGDVGLTLSYLVDTLVNAGRADEARVRAAELETIFDDHLDLALHPTRLCWSLAQFFDARGERLAYDRWLTRGRELLDAELARFDDPADVAAYCSLPFNAALLRQRSMNSQSSP